MDKYSILQKIGYGLVLALCALQFFQIDKTNPPSDPELDFMNITSPPDEIATILKTACYDCHSHHTEYPWYTNLQPVAWWIKDHIDHGRSELNFSEWGTYSDRRIDHKLEESAEYTLNEEMPLPSYLWSHADARLTDRERMILADWFEKQRVLLEEQQEDVDEENSETESSGD